MASSDTKNSLARAVALTDRGRCSRPSISFLLIVPDKPCINKKLSCTIKKYKKFSFGQTSAFATALHLIWPASTWATKSPRLNRPHAVVQEKRLEGTEGSVR